MTTDPKRCQPKQGDIAICHRGYIGLITSKQKEFRGHRGEAVGKSKWYGIHITPDKFGEPWESINPEVIGNITMLLMQQIGREIA